MRKSVVAVALLAACSGPADQPAAAARAAPAGGSGAVVVELFQSQGCSSCPPANANLNALAAKGEVIALSYAVTYWDQLGWKDTFAKPAFTERQRAYAKSGRSDGVYTPQVVINGRRALVGASRAGLDRALAAAGDLRGGPAIQHDGEGVTIAAGQGGPAAVLVVTYDPRERKVPVRAGENGGKTLPHRNIVTDLRRAATWTGQPLRLDLPAPPDPALRRAVLVQQGEGGPILAAARI